MKTLGLDYSRRLIRWGLSFCTLLATHHIGWAKAPKDKKVAVVTPRKQETSDADQTDKARKAKLKSELETENALNRVRLEKQLSSTIAQIERLRLEKELQRLSKEMEDENMRKEHDQAMRLLTMEKERLTMELEIAEAKFRQQLSKDNAQLIEREQKIKLAKLETELQKETTHRLQAEMEVLQAKSARDKQIQKKPIYLKDPLVKRSNTLVLSDRCIELNGFITPWKASYIVDQIHYFNNKNSEYPIFLIIGDSPGGSVIAGWDILQAIEHSKAPVYVVVKKYAASMAALITTLAIKSYTYPNAIILHHQPLSWVWGNLRRTKEHYEFLNQVWQRLGGRVAKKMGISLKAFEKKLYEKSMYGNWQEYGDNAKKLKWVDYVISGIQHSAVSSLPDAADYTFEKYIKEQYGFDATKGEESSAEAQYYQALAPHDFDYSYRPDRKAQVMGKR